MSQFGMQMPGGGSRRASMTVYTGLLFLAVVALATASYFMYTAASKVGLNGNPFEMQKKDDIKLAGQK